MQYMLLLYASEAHFQKMTDAEKAQGLASYSAFTDALKKADVLRASGRLRPVGNATTVRLVNEKAEVLDGPYADTKEQLGGYYLIDVADLDAALSWAARCPGARHGTIEVRPIWQTP